MNRRDFLRCAAGTGILGSATSSGALAAGGWFPIATSTAASGEASVAALDERWTLGLSSVTRDSLGAASGEIEILHGRIPATLRGTLYRNGPARHGRGGRRYTHWFDGDGMLQEFRFDDAGLSHRGRFVQTRKYREESRAGHLLYPGFGTRDASLRQPASADAMNPANISVIAHDGELLALWEGGSAHRVDPRDLSTIGRQRWSEASAGLPFSAHPKRDRDGSLWNFGIAPGSGRLVIWHIGADAALRQVRALPLPGGGAGGEPMVHDFAITARYLVFLLPPFEFSAAAYADGASFLDSHRWRADGAMRALLVDKADWDRQRLFELPAGFVFHTGGAWDDRDAVYLDYQRYADASVVTGYARQIMRGEPARADNRAVQLRLDLRGGGAQEMKIGGHGEFPRLHPRHIGRRYRYRYALADGAADAATRQPFFSAIEARDLRSAIALRYDYGAGIAAEEHIVVPRPGGSGERDAWLLGTALDWRRGRTLISVFDAAAVDAGPLFQAALPYALPLGFHGNFVTA